jgi:hypothetical protein
MEGFMNWDAIGAVSQALGSVAVIVSLGYLAQQIRQNTFTVRYSTNQAFVQTAQHELHWAQEMASTWTKTINSPEALTEEEVLSMSAWLRSFLLSRQNEFLQAQKGLLDESLWVASQEAIRLAFSPWAKNWWATNRGPWLTPPFIGEIERLVQPQPGT